jgi:hypothetical protein
MEIHGGRVDLIRNGPSGVAMRTLIPQTSID